MNFKGMLFLSAIVAACSTNPPPVPTTPQQSIVDGLKPFASFRESHGPGTVVRVDQDGSWRIVTTLDVDAQSGSEITYDISASRSFTANQFFDLVVDRSECAKASSSIKAGAGGLVSVSSVEGEREYLDDRTLDPAISDLQNKFASGEIRLRETNEYWIVRETIKTRSITYQSQKDWLLDANVNGALSSCAESIVAGTAGGGLFAGSGSTVKLDKEFSKPLRGWYLADKLVIDLPFGAAPGTPPEVAIDEAKSSESPNL